MKHGRGMLAGAAFLCVLAAFAARDERSLRCRLGFGTESEPSAVMPLTPTGAPVKVWLDEAALHVGDASYPWRSIGVVPTNGAAFRADLGKAGVPGLSLVGTIKTDALRFFIGGFGQIGNAQVSNEVRVVSSRDGLVKSAFRAVGATPDFIQDVSGARVKAGEPDRIVIRGRGTSSGVARYVLDDVDGKTACRICGPFRDPKLTFDFQHLWTDTSTKTLHVVIRNWSAGRGGGYTMRLEMRDLDTDAKLAWTRSAPMREFDGLDDCEFPVDDLAPGFYWAHVDVIDANGKAVHSGKARYAKPESPAPWEGTTLGMEDTVPPPWTEPVFRDDGFDCWNRSLRLGGDGVVSSVTSGGKELLAAPVSLVKDGRPLSFDVRLVEKRRSEATYLLVAREADVEVKAVCEFDGFVRFSVSYGDVARSMEWNVRLARENVICFDDCQLPAAKDLIGKSGVLRRDFNPGRCPFWWAGGTLGLMGGASNLHGWHVRNLASAGKLRTTEKELLVSMRFVGEKCADGRRRTVEFYLQPTPVKPKNMALASLATDRRETWTGYLCKFYEAKYPGAEEPSRFKKWREQARDGKRVFFYCASKGMSPENPYWGWYGNDWNTSGDPGYFAQEAPLRTESMRQHNNWTSACLNERGFLEHKVWGVNWYLNGGVAPEMKDLYFDVANAGGFCYNPVHGCLWTNDFGQVMYDRAMYPLRELHKRAYRLVKAKNPDGLLRGHVTNARTPADSFFDSLSMGEALDQKVRYTYNGKTYHYYDIFTPELMQSLFVSRGVDTVVDVVPQLLRCRECYAPHLLKLYNPKEPETDRAIRHAAAYILMHDLSIPRRPNHPEGAQWFILDSAVCALGPKRRYSAYFHDGDVPVTVDSPDQRFLWGYFESPEGRVLILLNDTDETVEKTVSVKGLSAACREILDGDEYDFRSGSCRLRFGPRGAKFLRFSR